MKSIKKVEYPNKNFYSYKDGVKIEDKQIEEWVNQVIQNLYEMKDTNDGVYSYVGSGNTLVIGFYTADNEIEVCVCRNYDSSIYSLDDLEDGIATINYLCISEDCPHNKECFYYVENENFGNYSDEEFEDTKLINIYRKNNDCERYL